MTPWGTLSRAAARNCRSASLGLALPANLDHHAVTVLLALCTVPDAESAERLSRTLVEERLAACVSRLPGGLRSVYRWQDEMHDDAEVLLLIKTTRDRFDALKSRLPLLHSHDVPELIAFDVVDGLGAYLDWVVAETRPR
jgi:periplasmic divalent cation tolerance protein